MGSDIAHDGVRAVTIANVVRACCCRTIRSIPCEWWFADEFGCSQSQTSIECFNVDVVTGPVNGQKTTFMVYDHSILDLNTGAFQDASGFGTILNSAFQVHGQTDSLNVDTSTVAGFFNQFCTGTQGVVRRQRLPRHRQSEFRHAVVHEDRRPYAGVQR